MWNVLFHSILINRRKINCIDNTMKILFGFLNCILLDRTYEILRSEFCSVFKIVLSLTDRTRYRGWSFVLVLKLYSPWHIVRTRYRGCSFVWFLNLYSPWQIVQFSQAVAPLFPSCSGALNSATLSFHFFSAYSYSRGRKTSWLHVVYDVYCEPCIVCIHIHFFKLNIHHFY